MVSLPIVVLIFISSNSRSGDLGPRALEPAANASVSAGLGGSDDNSSSSNGSLDFRVADSLEESLKLSGIIVNNETEEVERQTAEHLDESIISHREPKENEKTAKKEKAPVPLYSLVKNDCEKGYVMDQNGVCQKAILLKREKEFDSERRRRRSAEDDFGGQLKPFYEKPFPYKELYEVLKGSKVADCEKLYPGLVSDGNGGCKKSAALERFLNILEGSTYHEDLRPEQKTRE